MLYKTKRIASLFLAVMLISALMVPAMANTTGTTPVTLDSAAAIFNVTVPTALPVNINNQGSVVDYCSRQEHFVVLAKDKSWNHIVFSVSNVLNHGCLVRSYIPQPYYFYTGHTISLPQGQVQDDVHAAQLRS